MLGDQIEGNVNDEHRQYCITSSYFIDLFDHVATLSAVKVVIGYKMNTKQSNSNQEPNQSRREDSVFPKPLRADASMPHRSESIDSNKTTNRLPDGLRSDRVEEDFDDHPLIPARMVNEFVYCPRLAYLEWVQQEWEPSADTVEGTFVHRRVDRQADVTKQGESEGDDRPRIARAVELSSEDIGLIAKIDLLEVENNHAIPVEYKKGKRPHIKHNAWDPDRVQLCVQGLLLRKHGMQSEFGILYYAGSRERVSIQFDEDLINLTIESVNKLRGTIQSKELPKPLTDSPKCPRCSLVGVCLPDEVNLLSAYKQVARPISVRRTTSHPVYLQSHKGKVSKEGGELVITSDQEKGEVTKVRLSEISQMLIFGNAYITTPAMHDLLRRKIPVCWYTYGGWFLGHSVSGLGGNVELRTRQFRTADDVVACQRLASSLINAKIRNSRVLLMRNSRAKHSEELRDAFKKMNFLAKKANTADDSNELLGFEGSAAAIYFKHFSSMFSENELGIARNFSFAKRNRRPPLDPINAMLSFGYALLVRQFIVALLAVGLDPYKGFMHSERFGRPSLALDLMEPFRPLIVDSTVLTMVNNGEVKPTGFLSTAAGVAMKDKTRKTFIAAFERRLSQEITHPLFEYKIEYRRVFELQARLLGRYLLQEIPDYPNLVVR